MNADTNFRIFDGNTVAHIAFKKNNYDMIMLLV